MKLPILLVLLIPAFAAAQLDVDVRAEAALLINADTGAVLYEKNADLPLYPASITKIATALYTLEKASEKLGETVTISSNAIASISSKAREKSNYTVSPHWIEVGGSHIGLKAGEEVTLETLLYGLMLSSGNDAANALAEYVGEGSMNRFIEEMNAYLRSIGCAKTNFLSAHGHHHPDHITCARDMAIMARVGLKNPHFRKIVSTVTYKRPDTNKQKATTLVQTNKLLRKSSPYYYERAIGVKTGHGSEAKDALVAAAEWKGRTLIAVLMRSEKRQYNFEDAAKLFELAFNQPKLSKTIVAKGPQRYSLKLEGAGSTLGTYTDEEFKLEYYKGEDPKLEAFLTWKKDLELPIAQGDQVGAIAITSGGDTLLAKVPLYAKNSVHHSLKARLSNLLSGGGSALEYTLAIGIFLTLIPAGFILTRRR